MSIIKCNNDDINESDISFIIKSDQVFFISYFNSRDKTNYIYYPFVKIIYDDDYNLNLKYAYIKNDKKIVALICDDNPDQEIISKLQEYVHITTLKKLYKNTNGNLIEVCDYSIEIIPNLNVFDYVVNTKRDINSNAYFKYLYCFLYSNYFRKYISDIDCLKSIMSTSRGDVMFHLRDLFNFYWYNNYNIDVTNLCTLINTYISFVCFKDLTNLNMFKHLLYILSNDHPNFSEYLVIKNYMKYNCSACNENKSYKINLNYLLIDLDKDNHNVLKEMVNEYKILDKTECCIQVDITNSIHLGKMVFILLKKPRVSKKILIEKYLINELKSYKLKLILEENNILYSEDYFITNDIVYSEEYLISNDVIIFYELEFVKQRTCH